MPKNSPASKSGGDPARPVSPKPSTPRQAGRRPTREELSRHEREVRATRLLFAGMGAVFLLIVSILGLGWWREFVARPNDAVATVAGHNITLQDYARMLDLQRRGVEQQIQYLQFQLQLLGNDPANQSTIDLVRQQIQQLQFTEAFLPDQTLQAAIDRQLIRQEAARRNITVSPDEIDQEIKKQATAQLAQPTDASPTPASTSDQQATGSATGATSTPATDSGPTATPAAGSTPAAQSGETPAPTATTVDVRAWLDQYLRITGLSEAELRSIVEDQLLYQKLSDAMGAEVPTTAEQVHARHILVDTEDKAKQIEDQLKNGASFEDLAKAESTDTSTKDKGGDLGWFPRGKMVPEFEDAVFKLQPNEISDPVKTDYGFHIIQLLEKDPNRPLSPEDLAQKKADAIVQWLSDAEAGPDVKRLLTAGDKAWAYKRIGWAPPSLGQ